MHKFEVRARDPEKIMSGPNTLVFMDGVRLDRCTRFAFEVDAKGVAKISLDLLGSVAIVGTVGDIQEKIIPLVPKTPDPEPFV